MRGVIAGVQAARCVWRAVGWAAVAARTGCCTRPDAEGVCGKRCAGVAVRMYSCINTAGAVALDVALAHDAEVARDLDRDGAQLHVPGEGSSVVAVGVVTVQMVVQFRVVGASMATEGSGGCVARDRTVGGCAVWR